MKGNEYNELWTVIRKNDDYGILFIDGSKVGTTDDYESRSSDESSYSKKTTYSLERK